MVDLTGKNVKDCGWAGPLLWIITADGYSIHFFDAPIQLDGARLKAPENVAGQLSGAKIQEVFANIKGFGIKFHSGQVLKVASSDVETARFFKQKDLNSHVIFQNGTLSEDKDDA